MLSNEHSSQPLRDPCRGNGRPHFSLFTDRIGDWWPLGDYAVYDDGTIWAEVTEWHPPRVLRLSWHPGSTVERAADLRMRAH